MEKKFVTFILNLKFSLVSIVTIVTANWQIFNKNPSFYYILFDPYLRTRLYMTIFDRTMAIVSPKWAWSLQVDLNIQNQKFTVHT